MYLKKKKKSALESRISLKLWMNFKTLLEKVFQFSFCSLTKVLNSLYNMWWILYSHSIVFWQFFYATVIKCDIKIY